ncbi:MAG: hypothetical protein MJZ75_07015, partial [Paludibacteraceae bacterium]|nr:hypothetical protein [Paludibacteraceae bacterium]
WTTTNAAGCDSVVTLHIVALDTMMVDTADAVCRADLPYKWHGKELNAAGQFIDTLVNKAGCDSIVTLTLTVLEATKEDTTAYVCKNSTFAWHGHNPAKEGDTWTTTNAAGCDSVVTLHIVALDTMMVDTADAVCRADLPYKWHGKELNAAGQFIDTLVNKAGCDSIVTLTLTVLEATKEDTTAYVCKNSTFSWHGHNPAKEGDTWTTTNAAGCDSVVTLHIVYSSEPTTDSRDTIIYKGVEFDWHNIHIDHADTYRTTEIYTQGDFIGCDSAYFELNVTVSDELVFDNNHLTDIWSDAKNWWPCYDRIPTETDNVRIIEECHVDKANATAQDIKIHADGANGQLTILPQGALKVTGLIRHWDGISVTATTPADVLVQSNVFGNGVLVLNSDNTNVQGTVEYYSKAKDKSTPSPIWQYMGSPMKEKDTKSAYYGNASEIYYWSDQPNYHLGGNWKAVESADEIAPFNGYCITQDNPYTYVFSGALNQPITTQIDLPFYGHSRMPGYVLVANSWVAPIDITSMELSDFGNADATVYIFNSGTYDQAVAQTTMEQGTSLVPGQYNAIPVKAASYMGLTSIPPMQGFFVHTNSNTSMSLDYQRTVYDQATYSTEAMRAPRRAALNAEPYMIRFDMTAKHGADRLYMMESPAFTDEFDNGWEARYMDNENHCALAASTQAGAMAVAALPDVSGTELQFEHGVDTRFFITIHTTGESQIDGTLYLHDLLLNTYTTIEEGATYEFTPQICNGNRFRIERAGEKVANEDELPFKFIRNNKLVIRLHGEEYNAVGGQAIR